MKKSELKAIIRECIEESFLVDELESLDEKTPNQRAHPRNMGKYGTRPNTISNAYDQIGARDDIRFGKTTTKNGKKVVTKNSQRALKDRIKKDRKINSDREKYGKESVFSSGTYTKQGHFKPRKYSSYKKSGIGR